MSHKLLQKVTKLKNTINIDENFKLECLVSEEKLDCYRFIDRKHDKGNNEVRWNEPERNNYSIRRGNANFALKLKLALTNYIRGLNDIPEQIKSTVLGKGYVTLLYRLTTTGPPKKMFNLDLNEDGSLKFDEESKFPIKLRFIILNLFGKEKFNDKPFNSRTFNETPQIKDYLESLPSKESLISAKIKKLKKKDLFGKESVTKPNKPIEKKQGRKAKPIEILPKSSNRAHLIPKNCRIRINPNKINDIYRELRDDLLLNDSNQSVPNAVGVLFRVFLEISLDEYAEQNGTIFKKDDNISKKIPWVIDSLIQKGYDKKTFNEIRKVGSAKSEKSFLSIERFHEYVHSKTVQPSPNELKIKWDLLQPFFELLWDDLNKKTK